VVKSVLIGLTALTFGVPQIGCSSKDASRDAVQAALHAAWRAYTVESPAERASTSAGMARTSEMDSEAARFESEGRASIASLDSALDAIPTGGGKAQRYLRETLAGLVSTLRERHDADLAILQGIRDQALGVTTDEDTGEHMMKTMAVAHGVTEQTILRLAAWERRFLHESYLADSYVGRRLALIESARVGGTPDSVLKARSEIETLIASWDSVVVAEISHISGGGR